MKKTFAKIAALVSAAVLCAVPMTTSMTANAVNYSGVVLRGDANGDGQIDMADALTIDSYLRFKPVNINRANADFNSNGTPDITDMSLIQRYLLHSLKLGDANGDGVVNNADVQAMSRYTACGQGNIVLYLADVNKDGKVTVSDTFQVKKYVNRTINNLYYNFGDANNDGIIDMADAVTISMFNSGATVSINSIQADVTGEGVIDVSDEIAIRRYLLGEGFIVR